MDRLLELRKQVAEGLATTRIVRDVLDGKPNRDHYVRYLETARWYAQYSPVLMGLASSRMIRSHPELGRYLLEHGRDEEGHDAWALEDLVELGVDAGSAIAAPPVPSCAALVGFVHFLAGHDNPVGVYGWMYVLEAVGDDLGTEVGRLLDEGLGLGGKAIRFVAGHGVADHEHTAELTEMIGRHVRAPEDVEAVDRAAGVVADLYVRMFREVGQESARWD